MKLVYSAFAAILLAPLTSFGAAGMFDQFVIVNTTGNTYYDIGATTGNPDFQSSSLGTFTNADTLRLGGQGKSYKNNGTDVTGMQLWYRVYEGVTPVGGFTNLDYFFKSNIGGGGDQEWGTDTGSPSYTSNFLTGLLNGTYTVEVYSTINTNGVNEAFTVYNSNGSNNFKASFTVVPEPSRAVLLLGGLGVLVMRRRRA
ncbi:MAG: PEP-CTERM sorting domain-containing protein [Verrucomicrobiaceae bacterium]|nr:PEP-CTERM sorting domain-containing protein [Verrucomicrobiaceae bacterium]